MRAHLLAISSKGFRHARSGKSSRLLACIWAIVWLVLAGCQESSDSWRTVTIWHQLTPRDRALLEQRADQFAVDNPGTKIRVRVLYKETEELRSGFQAAALAGIGPELIHGPSDALGAFHAMGIIEDLSQWMERDQTDAFLPKSLIYVSHPTEAGEEQLLQIPDRFGNHLALVYNSDFIKEPPKTTDDLIKLGGLHTFDKNKDGRMERYGLVWNYTEPFFAIPFLTGHGAWVIDESAEPTPTLDTPESVAAYEFILSLRDEHKIVPPNCDYETADSLFKSGKAAMMINGDWSWADYLNTDGISAKVAPLPIVNATGKPMGPIISPKGYSLNANLDPKDREAALKVLEFLISEETQRFYMRQGLILPSRKDLYDDPFIENEATLQASKVQIENGQLMPIATEMRAVWDAMRPAYQSLLGGNISAEEAARQMQVDAEKAIDTMYRDTATPQQAWFWQLVGLLICAGLVYWQRESLVNLIPDFRRQPIAYCFVMPSILVILLTVAFPFVYNVLLSLSNMSLTNVQEWEIVGFQNFQEVFAEDSFYVLLAKTLLWTVVNVTFHAVLGVLLAMALNGPIRGKPFYRICLIIPWAVPGYITALTWRSMFHYDYGAVNLLLNKMLGLDPINWLTEPNAAFAACIVANVWLGYPFMMVIALGGLQGIPNELYEAARIDGASRWHQFWYVTLPLLKPVLAPAITLGAIWTFNNLNVVWLVSNGGEPSDETHILVSFVYKAVFNLYRYGYGAALSMVIFVILLCGSLLGLRRTRATESVYV